MTDWRPAHLRRDVFLDSWEFHLRYGTLPGCVHHLLPAIIDHYSDANDEAKAWLVWLNGNTQNPVTSLLLFEASAGSAKNAMAAIEFWNDYFTALQWDTDRRHQKSKFAEATTRLITAGGPRAELWHQYGILGWPATWNFAIGQPYMGRLSAWSMIEYARILFGADVVPDADDLMLRDWSGSRSHRNGLGVVMGLEGAEYWGSMDFVDHTTTYELNALAESLLAEMKTRRPEASRLDLESALCTYKGWHKPNRRYPNVYADMAYYRIRIAEERFGRRLDVLWEARRKALPTWARLEDTPRDPGLVPAKQNLYLETGEIPMMGHVWPQYWSSFDERVHGS